MRTRYLPLAALLLVLAAAALLVRRSSAPAEKAEGGLRVITTLFPLYDMASAIGGGRAEVSMLLPPGMEPHSFEPRPGDMARLERADIFVYTGSSMEPWAGDLVRASANRELLAVDAGRDIVRAAGPSGGAPDPHIWLDFDNAKVMARTIADAFQAKDPANAEAYRRAAAQYVEKLSALDMAYRNGLARCRTRNIVYGGHYAFAYMARRYGLEYSSAQGISPDSEPTARDLAALVEQIRREKIKSVFYEELASPKIAETVARETGAGMLMLNAAHNVSRDQLRDGVTFFDILGSDLAALREGLECR